MINLIRHLASQKKTMANNKKVEEVLVKLTALLKENNCELNIMIIDKDKKEIKEEIKEVK